MERSSNAREAVDIIAGLIATHGQGGPCSNEPGKEGWAFHNSYLIADSSEAWIMETAGSLWAAEQITGSYQTLFIEAFCYLNAEKMLLIINT